MEIRECSLQIGEKYQEIDTRGTPMFPCAAYITTVGRGGMKEIPWHWHREIEFIVVRSGCLILRILDKEYQLNEGEGIFINAGILQTAAAKDGNRCELISFVLDQSVIAGASESIIAQQYVWPVTENNCFPCSVLGKNSNWGLNAVQKLIEAFDCYREGEFGFELLVREKLSYVWYLIVFHNKDHLRKNADGNIDYMRLKLMLGFIHEYYASDILLKKIAASAAISERECLRCFHRTIGFSPMQYVEKFRISVASRLLVSTNQSITEISQECGFDSPSYFSLIFKKHIQMTPKEYRNYMEKR